MATAVNTPRGLAGAASELEVLRDSVCNLNREIDDLRMLLRTKDDLIDALRLSNDILAGRAEATRKAAVESGAKHLAEIERLKKDQSSVREQIEQELHNHRIDDLGVLSIAIETNSLPVHLEAAYERSISGRVKLTLVHVDDRRACYAVEQVVD